MTDSIQVMQLRKTYHKKQVVDEISFHVKKGTLFAFIGPNGAGKSTTMGMLSLLLKKSGGSIRIDGLDADRHTKAVKKKIGVVFQDDVLDYELTVSQNLAYRGGLYIHNAAELKRSICSICKLLHLTELLPKPYGKCSGGQRRLVQIARALLPRPSLLILDEPTTGLDPKTRREVWDALLLLKTQLNMTVFYSTHSMEEASYADQVCFLNHGRITAFGSPETLLGRQNGTGSDELYIRLLREGGAV